MGYVVIATYDLVGAEATRGALPGFVSQLKERGATIVFTDTARPKTLRESAQGVTLVVEFSSEAKAWAGNPEAGVVRQAWFHPQGEAPRLRPEDLDALS